MRAIALLLGLALAAPAVVTPASAQPATGCDPSVIDALGSLVDALGDLRAASPADRRAATEKLLGILRDSNRTGSCDKSRPRYEAASLLEEIAGLATGADRSAAIDALLTAAAGETDSALKRQMTLGLDRLASSGAMTASQKAMAATLADEFLPQSPHYETLFGKDGKKREVNVTVHTANKEDRFSYYENAFRGAKKLERTADGHLYIEYEVTPDDPTGRYQPVTYKIRVLDEHAGDMSNFDIFRDMGSDDPAVEVYNYHSQYGSSLTRSIDNATANPDSKKIFFLGNCKSHVNMGRIESKFPRMGSMYTIDNQYMIDTPPTLKHLLKELVNRPTWAQINRSMQYANLLRDDNYLMPDDRRRLAYLDTDFDGVPDSQDRLLDCGLVKPGSSHDYAAKTPPAGRLDGEKILYAAHAARGILGATDLTESLKDAYLADGWAPADPAGPRFYFEQATVDGRAVTKVKVNAAYSHLSDTALTGAMLRDFVMHDRTKNGRTATRDDEVLAYGMGVKLFDVWSSTKDGGAAYREFQKAYSLGKNISLYDAASKIDHDRGVTRATIAHIRSRVD